MATDDPIRASDSDREVVVATLRDAYTAGRLTLDEFDERTTAAYEGKTWGDLRQLTADLPAQPILGGDVPGRHFPGSVGPALPPPVGLPVHPPRESLPPVRSRRNPVAILLPVLVWTVLATHAGPSRGFAFLVLAMVAFAVIVSAIRRR